MRCVLTSTSKGGVSWLGHLSVGADCGSKMDRHRQLLISRRASERAGGPPDFFIVFFFYFQLLQRYLF